MAKSKSGGTRSYIRGKIGADVYSIGKNGKGQKQQVVRSLAEVVSNPQTEAQMRGRMIMSSVMQAVAFMSPIIDHSFDNVPNGQPSISEFIRRNYALVKEDAAAHPASGNVFGLNKYQQKGFRGGKYVIAAGQVIVPSTLQFAITSEIPTLTIDFGSDPLTVANLKAKTGLKGGDYMTVIFKNDDDGTLMYSRIYISDTVADDTVISSSNVNTVFSFDQNFENTPTVAAAAISFAGLYPATCAGFIVSSKGVNGWEHNNTTMLIDGTMSYASDVALPTYPQGSARFLNGGDI